jgi:hypothetical protein
MADFVHHFESLTSPILSSYGSALHYCTIYIHLGLLIFNTHTTHCSNPAQQPRAHYHSSRQSPPTAIDSPFSAVDGTSVFERVI